MNSADQNTAVVVVDQVWCAYGDFIAVRDVSFVVTPGTIHALLGTNGAGKTTLLETIQGFRAPAQGAIKVFGHDPARERTSIAARTGTMLQESGLVDEMTVDGQLSLWQGLSLREDNKERVLELVGLTHRKNVAVSVLSGGERRRLDFAMALWGSPELVVLDEPTTGLDAQSRHTMWGIISDLVADGTAVLLTTHYLEEAQRLASTVTILDRGNTAKQGTMSQVLASIPATAEFATMASESVLSGLSAKLAGKIEIQINDQAQLVRIHTPQLQSDMTAVVDWARDNSLNLDQLRCAPASLEDVFLQVAEHQQPPANPGAARTSTDGISA